MKRTSALRAVTALAALSLTGQAFAMGGSMGGGQGHGTMSGNHQMTSTMSQGNGGGKQSGSGMHDGPMNGTTGPESMMQDGAGNANRHQHREMNSSGNDTTATLPPATPSTN